MIRSPFEDKGAIARAEKAVSEIESTKAALQQLTAYMASAHLEAAKRLERLRASSLSIPDEILSQILLCAAQCNQNHVFHTGNTRREVLCAFRSAVALSHVCKRFRLVSLHTPALWNRISDSMSPDVVDICLGRSGVLPLEIFLNPFIQNSEKHTRQFKNFVQAISPSAERWSAFTLHNTGSKESRHAELGHLSLIEDVFEGLHAPQLKSLEIHIPVSRSHSPLSIIPRRFCHIWNVPQLQTMVASQFIPSLSLNRRCSEVLISSLGITVRAVSLVERRWTWRHFIIS